MRTYQIELNKDGEPITVELRLTLGGQFTLKKKFGENALSTIFGAIDDVSRLIAVFNECLNYKGNTNEIHDAGELYELIVENDLGGVSGFQTILTGIARESGLLTEKEKAAIDAKAETMFDDEDETDSKNAFPLPSMMS